MRFGGVTIKEDESNKEKIEKLFDSRYEDFDDKTEKKEKNVRKGSELHSDMSISKIKNHQNNKRRLSLRGEIHGYGVEKEYENRVII